MWYLSFQTGDQNQIESVITDWNTTGTAKDQKKKQAEELFVKTFSTLLVKVNVVELDCKRVFVGSLCACAFTQSQHWQYSGHEK